MALKGTLVSRQEKQGKHNDNYSKLQASVRLCEPAALPQGSGGRRRRRGDHRLRWQRWRRQPSSLTTRRSRKPGTVWFAANDWKLADETKEAVKGGIYRSFMTADQAGHYDAMIDRAVAGAVLRPRPRVPDGAQPRPRHRPGVAGGRRARCRCWRESWRSPPTA